MLLPPAGSAAAAATTGALPAAADATTACRRAGCRAGRRGCCCASAGCTVSERQAHIWHGSGRSAGTQQSSRGERRSHATSPRRTAAGRRSPARCPVAWEAAPRSEAWERHGAPPGAVPPRGAGPGRAGRRTGAAAWSSFGLPAAPGASSDWFRGDVYAQRRAGTVARERRLGAAAAGFRSGARCKRL